MRLQLLGAKKTKDFEGAMASAQRKAFKPANDEEDEAEEEQVEAEEAHPEQQEEETKEEEK